LVYNDYVLTEWKKFQAEQHWREALLKATKKIDVRRFLDVGCVAGQEMLPFTARSKNRRSGLYARIVHKRFAAKGFGEKVELIRASGDALPFAEDAFDVLICRIALRYMNVKPALREMAQILRPRGVFFKVSRFAILYVEVR
jgi:ubiquinone/menaquinone biosynthesis C-methylase UbiE